MTSWVPVPDGSPFPLDHLPYAVYSRQGREGRVGVGIGDHVLDLTVALDDPTFARPSLDAFLAQGPDRWREVRERVTGLLSDDRHRSRLGPALFDRWAVTLALPFTVADFVDFYSSLHHATNVGRMFRPDREPLQPNWRHLPVAYHGRAGTVVVSGTPVVRPWGQFREPGSDRPTFGPTRRLDLEAEVGFVVGVPSQPGRPVPADALADHVFGVVLCNDWSARDIQAWETVPLGPHLGKSFATSTSAWVTPLAALDAAWTVPPAQDPEPLAHLGGGAGLDLALEVRINDHVVSRPPSAGLYWTPAQQLAHLTSNGAHLRTGDLWASGTVSGPEPDERGCLLELTWNGTDPVDIGSGATRTFLEDGDAVTITATAPGTDGGRIGLGAVTGTVHPAGRGMPATVGARSSAPS